jgi:hypothetical protein
MKEVGFRKLLDHAKKLKEQRAKEKEQQQEEEGEK